MYIECEGRLRLNYLKIMLSVPRALDFRSTLAYNGTGWMSDAVL